MARSKGVCAEALVLPALDGARLTADQNAMASLQALHGDQKMAGLITMIEPGELNIEILILALRF